LIFAVILSRLGYHLNGKFKVQLAPAKITPHIREHRTILKLKRSTDDIENKGADVSGNENVG
jgi:hypothetical protein